MALSDNALFRPSPHINQTLHQNIRILHFCPVDSLVNYAADFVVSWIEVRAVWWPKNVYFSGVTTIS